MIENFIEKVFQLKKYNTNVKTEFIAGLVTFCAMIYILIVNANMYTNPLGNGENIIGISYGAVYVATAITAVIGCFLMGFIANLPIGLASGMGLNAFFIYTVCISFGFSYENALVTILIEGLIFLFLVLSGGLNKIYDAIPSCVRSAISIGIGLFLALLGLQNARIIIPNVATGISLNSFNILTVPVQNIIPAFVALITLFIIAVMAKKNIKGAVLWGMLIGVVIYYISGLFVPSIYENLNISLNPIASFRDFYNDAFCAVFYRGFDFSTYISKHGIHNLMLILFTTSISFCLVNIFDNLGSLQATCEHGNLLNENGTIKNVKKAMLANSLSATIGSTMGISTVTSFVESTTGIMEGGRTGLTTIFIGLFFLIAMFLSPLAQFIPSCVTAAALIFVGVLMMSSVKNINWSSIEDSIPAFLTICMMPFSYNISNGIAFGLIAYAVITTCIGKFKEIKPTTWLIVILFLAMLLFSH